MDHILRIDDDLELRPPQIAYAPLIFRLLEKQREYLRTWLPWVDKTKAPEHLEWFLKESRKFNQGGQKLTLFIFWRGELVGSVGLVAIHQAHKNGEIGYWLSENYQGKGLITRSCQRLIEYAFEELQLHKLVIKVAVENSRSRKVPERLGFTLEGSLRDEVFFNKKFHNLAVYGLLHEDWKT